MGPVRAERAPLWSRESWPRWKVPRFGVVRVPLSLGAVSAAALIVAALLLAVVAGLLIQSTTRMRESAQVGMREHQIAQAVLRVEADLLRYVGLSAAALDGHRAELEAHRSAARARIDDNVATAIGLATGARDRDDLDRLRDELASYFELRDRLEAQHASPRRMTRLTRPRLAATLDAIRATEHDVDVEMERMQTRADAAVTTARSAGTLALAVLLVGFVVVAFGLLRYVVLPLRAITEAVRDVRLGETKTRAPERGFAELVGLARTLNQATAALTEQRTLALAFLAGAAHDLRNPLSGLRISIGFLRQAEPEIATRPASARTFALLERQIDRLSRLVSDLVDAARIEAGELQLALEDHDLRASAREMVELYAPTTDVHRIELDVPDAPVMVRADPLRMEQVASNLISNAIKYSPGGGMVRVAVRVEGDEAVLSVTDEGVGIPADQIDTIFEPFRRAGGAVSVAAGAGLGLSVLRRIVRAHGGNAEVESAPGRGSTFRVRLPLASTTAPEAAP